MSLIEPGLVMICRNGATAINPEVRWVPGEMQGFHARLSLPKWLKLPRSRIELSRVAADAFTCCGATFEVI